MGTPIERFNNNEELRACLKEWQHRLFLDNWNIKGYLAYGADIPEKCGMSHVQWENSCGTIRILRGEEIDNNDCIEREPHEKILVHELLHFVYMSFGNEHPGVEDVYFDTMQHQILERMAKSLIMAKYDLDYSYFTDVG